MRARLRALQPESVTGRIQRRTSRPSSIWESKVTGPCLQRCAFDPLGVKGRNAGPPFWVLQPSDVASEYDFVQPLVHDDSTGPGVATHGQAEPGERSSVEKRPYQPPRHGRAEVCQAGPPRHGSAAHGRSEPGERGSVDIRPYQPLGTVWLKVVELNLRHPVWPPTVRTGAALPD